MRSLTFLLKLVFDGGNGAENSIKRAGVLQGSGRGQGCQRCGRDRRVESRSPVWRAVCCKITIRE